MRDTEKHFTEYIGVRVEPELAEEIRRAADREERTVSSFVRLYLKALVDHDRRRPTRERVPA